MKKQTLLIDIDDVLEDLVGAWTKWLNDKYGTSVSSEDITEWDITLFFPALTKEQIFEPLHIDDFWKTVEPRKDAMEYVKKLFSEGYEIYLCTSTDYRNIVAKYEYIVKRFYPYIDWKHIIITDRKQLIQADFLIDDGVHNLKNGNYKKILFSTPHNKNYDAESNGMFRAEDWSDAYKIIHREVKND